MNSSIRSTLSSGTPCVKEGLALFLGAHRLELLEGRRIHHPAAHPPPRWPFAFAPWPWPSGQPASLPLASGAALPSAFARVADLRRAPFLLARVLTRGAERFALLFLGHQRDRVQGDEVARQSIPFVTSTSLSLESRASLPASRTDPWWAT